MAGLVRPAAPPPASTTPQTGEAGAAIPHRGGIVREERCMTTKYTQVLPIWKGSGRDISSM